jgi:hypothetical protein
MDWFNKSLKKQAESPAGTPGTPGAAVDNATAPATTPTPAAANATTTAQVPAAATPATTPNTTQTAQPSGAQQALDANPDLKALANWLQSAIKVKDAVEPAVGLLMTNLEKLGLKPEIVSEIRREVGLD